jgi:hypothetical protein
VNEGSAIGLSLSGATDPSAADRAAGFSYAFDCGSGYGAWSSSASASCATTDNGSRTVRGKLRDKDGGEHAYDAVVSIANLPPMLGALQGPAGSVKKRTEVSVSGAFSDAGSADTHSATISWGDGSSSAATITGDVASGTHTYNTAGTYAVSMVVTDKKGQKDIEKGVFGFEAKAKRGRRDECEAVLGFHSRAVDFKATSCDSFLVSGTKAVVKGVGRLDHERGTYSYVLCVIDAGGRREDRMHLRIWNTATGRVLFDNQPGAALDVAEKKIGDGRIFVRDR